MNKINVLSLFSGIGAFENALIREKVEFNLVNYCEIDNNASKCYSTLYNEPESKNLWDVTKIKTKELLGKDIKLLFHGSPCQSFSIAGKQLGGDKDSGTTSSLLWDSVRIIKDILPKVVIWEQVPNVLSDKHKHNFDMYIKELDKLGYCSNYQILKGNDYGIPQIRKRLFAVSILNGKEFVFPKKVKLSTTIKDYASFREQDDITFNFVRRYNSIYNTNITEDYFIKYVNGLEVHDKGELTTKKLNLYNYNQSDTLNVLDMLSPTLTCSGVQNYCIKFLYNNKIYKPSPLMCWKLMGFSDDDFNKCKKFSSDVDLGNRVGNSIIVDVAQAIIKELMEQVDFYK